MNSKRSSHRSLSGCPYVAAKKKAVLRVTKLQTNDAFHNENSISGAGLYNSKKTSRNDLKMRWKLSLIHSLLYLYSFTK